MRCKKCNTFNNTYHIYCYHCGAKLSYQDSSQSVGDEGSNMAEKPTKTESDFEDLDLLPTTFRKRMPKEHSPIDSEEVSNEEIAVDNGKDSPSGEDITMDRGHRSPDEESAMAGPHYILDEDEDLSPQPPMRRARRTKKEEDKSLQVVIRVCSIIIIISILAFAGLVIYDKFIKDRPTPQADATLSISADYSAIQDTIDGEHVHRIVIETDIGQVVKILDKTATVEDGIAEIVLKDSELMELGDEIEPGGGIKVSLDVTISASGARDREDKVSFEVAPRTAPLNMIHPKTEEFATESDTITLSMEVVPESNVLINGDNFSDLITKEGRLEKSFQLTGDQGHEFKILVSTNGYSDTEHIIRVVRDGHGSNGILRVNEKQPIKTTGEWVKITGTTKPGASLEVMGVEVKPDFNIDDDGEFSIYVKTANIGYSLCTLNASTEDGQKSSLDIVLERPTTEAEYTSKAWEFIYEEMVREPSLHSGRIFLLTGKVVDILAVDGSHVFILDMSQTESTEQLVHVEYWGNMKVEEGQTLKIFGNRWGNREDIPRILTQFMYKI